MNKIKLKGGSLCGTFLIDDGETKFVRKEVSLTENRIYGYQRWYSQYKRLQRYSVLFPSMFPNVLGMGVSGDLSYFDIEYVEDSKTGFEFLCESDNDGIDVFFEKLLTTMETLYTHKIPSDKNSMELYLREEVDERIKDTLLYDGFKSFTDYDTITFQGVNIPSFLSNIEIYKKIALDHYKNPIETFTHGNLTLENILYVPKTKEVKFIDPYEENVIDSDLAEISQLLQSCNSLYEVYNEKQPTIVDNIVDIRVDISGGMGYFNDKLHSWIRSNYNLDDYITIKVLEISQFIRMLPFKMAVDRDKTIFFYSLASKLLDDLIKEIKI